MNNEATSPKRVYRRAEDWDKIISEFNASSQTKATFCAARGLNAHLFYKALKRHEAAPSFARYKVEASPQVFVDVAGCRVSLSGIDPVEFVKALAR